ncbi:MAG: pyrroline-5-carboxylate reductase [Candidatus Tectomicrobia bacterium]|uniref:Pyrroline-5-carboxylate reductase n=1 Tax=Tectimicrobiota bacterium TaxID=2528274 RepID=A0A932CPE2_UNCTE|nr:pyrroline-5-carboxylate reductase [Candidatus Tectomicrobia bacterium]
MEGKRLSFIGGGNMAEAMLKGLLQSRQISSEAVMVSDINAARLQFLQERYRVKISSRNAETAAWGQVVVLAVKPQIIREVLEDIRPVIDGFKLVISIAAGIPLKLLATHLEGGVRLVRVMPNAPALIQMGATAIALGERATAEDGHLVEGIFQALGETARVEEELMDAVTGLSGSGPAYVCVIIEALADGGVKMGLSREVALRLAAQTVLGSARMLLESGEHPGQLKDRVASPGGTTIAGLHQMELGGVRAALMSAVEAATLRSRELGRRVGRDE